MSEPSNEVEGEAGPGGVKLRVRGYDFLTIFVCVGVVSIAYILYMHMQDSSAKASEIAVAIKEMTLSQKEATREQRLSTCIQATREDDKERQYSNPNSACNRMAR